MRIGTSAQRRSIEWRHDRTELARGDVKGCLGRATRPALLLSLHGCRYHPGMEPDEPATAEPSPIEYDVWSWHTEGEFPADQPREFGYVHIGMFLAWLVDLEMLDQDWVARSGAESAVAAIRERHGSVCALRDISAGRFASDMLTAEGQAFAGAYYAPEYGYPRDWRRVFGRRADRYAVPDEWETYDHIGPVIERRYRAWIAAGRPDLMPLPRLLSALLALVRPRAR
jgi:hypothetical protein